MIPRSRRSLSLGKDQSFGGSDNAGTKADKWPAGGTLHAKEEVGRGGGAVSLGPASGDRRTAHGVSDRDFGLWRVYFPPILIRTDRRLLV